MNSKYLKKLIIEKKLSDLDKVILYIIFEKKWTKGKENIYLNQKDLLKTLQIKKEYIKFSFFYLSQKKIFKLKKTGNVIQIYDIVELDKEFMFNLFFHRFYYHKKEILEKLRNDFRNKEAQINYMVNRKKNILY